MGWVHCKKWNIFVVDQEWEYVCFPLKIQEIKDRNWIIILLSKKKKLLENPKPYPATQSIERKAALSALLNWPTEKASELQAQTSPW